MNTITNINNSGNNSSFLLSPKTTNNKDGYQNIVNLDPISLKPVESLHKRKFTILEEEEIFKPTTFKKINDTNLNYKSDIVEGTKNDLSNKIPEEGLFVNDRVTDVFKSNEVVYF